MGRKYTVDVDIGGTLTDGLFSDGERTWVAKVDTTPHDFTVCFFEALREGANLTGRPGLAEFLEEVAVIRWSSTIATNVLAEEKGPRLGLLLTPGHEKDLYGEGDSPAVGHIVAPDNIATVGNPKSDEEVLTAIRALLERGVRRICVSGMEVVYGRVQKRRHREERAVITLEGKAASPVRKRCVALPSCSPRKPRTICAGKCS